MNYNMKPYFIIDPGHGPKQKGKRSPFLDDGRQFLEWESNWKVADRLMQMVVEHGVFNVELSLKISRRKIGQMLPQRIANINAIAQGAIDSGMYPVAISIHSNAFTNNWSTPSGIETYYFNHEEMPINKAFASAMNSEIVNDVGFRNRGVRSGNHLSIIRNTKCSTLLTETGFYTNMREVQYMMTDEFVEKSAAGHLKGMIRIAEIINESE
jgi:N-acetylmuramoyl-L-alanine amidase